MNLIRLGILWGKGKGAYDRGYFEKDWGCLSNQTILDIYTSLCQKLKQLPYGPFDALSLLIGDRNARIFCNKNSDCTIRPPLHSSSAS